MIRAKFRVHQVGKTQSGYSVDLYPVTGGSKENETFFKYTPSGKIELYIVSEDTLAQFGEPGSEVYVDFTAAPKETS